MPNENYSSYNYGSKSNNTMYTIGDYISSIKDKYPKPDPIEEQINVADYETAYEIDIPIDLIPEFERKTFEELLENALPEKEFPTISFDQDKFDDMVGRTWHSITNLTKLKGGEYAGDVDRLANFRNQAAQLGLPMEVIWAVYANKHWSAIMQYVQDIRGNKVRDRMETIESRCDDLIVYLLLFKAMRMERNEK